MIAGLRRMAHEVGPILLRGTREHKTSVIRVPDEVTATSADSQGPMTKLSSDSQCKSSRIDPVFVQDEDILRMILYEESRMTSKDELREQLQEFIRHEH
ncbi:hypothetical protein AC249_AIPGENE27082 [Exaiptasia diaphana]|nr:hypothetical protein AC249_AIPGENE27082 [Exaiptasia diaphana]